MKAYGILSFKGTVKEFRVFLAGLKMGLEGNKRLTGLTSNRKPA